MFRSCRNTNVLQGFKAVLLRPSFGHATPGVAWTILRRRFFVGRTGWSRVETFQVAENGQAACISCCLWPANMPPTTEWGYDDHLNGGPEVWSSKYPEAKGQRQSPIDIVTSATQSSSDLVHRPLTCRYGSQICKFVLNTGCGWRVDIGGSDSVLSGGPLKHSYQLVQFHCHWGRTSQCGSEHTVDGKAFAAEIHFVHWNKDLYDTCAEAVRSPKGLSVLGVFLEVGDECNPEMEKLCLSLEHVTYKDQRAELHPGLNPKYILPVDQSYWTYEGSLTTPPCYETVTWIVFKKPIKISEKQMQEFRNMCSYCKSDSCPGGEFSGKVIQNFRPPQPLHGRCVMDSSY